MSRQIMLEQQELNGWIYSRVASLVSLIASPVSAEQAMTTETYGLSWLESLASLNPDGSWAKTYQGYCQVRLDGSLEEFSGTWPRLGIVLDGLCMVPRTLERPTDETESSSWPTPTANGNYNRKGASANSGDGLETAVKMWPTPKAVDYRSGSKPDSKRIQRKKEQGWSLDLNDAAYATDNHGQLNPDWVECLMGFPIGWTSIDGPLDSEKRSTTGSRRESLVHIHEVVASSFHTQ